MQSSGKPLELELYILYVKWGNQRKLREVDTMSFILIETELANNQDTDQSVCLYRLSSAYVIFFLRIKMNYGNPWKITCPKIYRGFDISYK